MSRRALPPLLLAPLLLLLAAPLRAQDATPEAGGLRVAEVTPVEIPDTRLISLSPDGRLLAATDFGQARLCTYDAVSLAERACADLAPLESGLRIEDVEWSPDSTRLAMAELSFQRFVDGDLWVMDAATGALTDATDDGFAGPIPIFEDDEEGVELFVDVDPAWSPDGRRIAFSRTAFRDGAFAGNELAVVELGSGEVRTVQRVTTEEPGVVYFGIDWTADGERLFYTVSHGAMDDPENGVWLTGAAGGLPRQVAERDEELGFPAVLDAAPDGATVLVHYPSAEGQYSSGGVPSFVGLLDVASGEVDLLTLEGQGAPAFAHVRMAALSPDGGTALLWSRLTDPDNQIFAHDVEEDEAVPLLPEGVEQAFTIGLGVTPSWSDTGVLFFNTDLDGGLLVRLVGPGATAPAPAAPGAATPGATAQPVGSPAVAAEGDRYVVNDADVPLRSAPSTEATIVLRLAQGAEVVAVGPAVEADGRGWLPVVEPATGTIGYVRTELLDPVAG